MTIEPWGSMRRAGRRGARRVPALAAALAAFAARPLLAAPTERFAEREGLSCSACHVGRDGGALNQFGRDYRWRAPFLEDGQGGGPLPAGTNGSSSPAATGAGFGGRWAGELAWYGRRGATRSIGERVRTSSSTETLRLRGDGLFGSEAWSFRGDAFASQANGGGELDFDPYDDDALGFNAAELTWHGDATGSFARIGRQFVVAGAATRRIDGGALRHPLGRHLELDLFGGVPAEDGLGGRGGDVITGGRLGALVGRSVRVGGSAFYAKDHSDPSDVKGGIDFEWTPARAFELFSHVYWDWLADQLYDARVHALVTPSITWQLAFDWTRSVPGLFLPKSSLYSVFSDEEYDESAITVTRRFSASSSARVFGRYTDYAQSDSLAQYGAGLDLRYGPNGEDAVGVEGGWQDESRTSLGVSSTDDDALFVRAYHLLYWTERLYHSLDASTQFVADSGYERDAALVRLALGWDPRSWWDAQLGCDWVRDPDFEDGLELFARLRVRF